MTIVNFEPEDLVLTRPPDLSCACAVPVMQVLTRWALAVDSDVDVVRSIQCTGCYKPVHPSSNLHPDHHLHAQGLT